MKTRELKQFLNAAISQTYTRDGLRVESQRSGFYELEYSEGDWLYRDSFAGFFRSWGQEVVWHLGIPVWSSCYGGGMEDAYLNDQEFTHQTFEFLKKSLSYKSEKFQPRGPNKFSDNDWQYRCSWTGDITKFKGSEEISFQDKLVFTHEFFGGNVIRN
jgi:hypothetical protein